MTALEMLEAFELRQHWKICEWEAAGADPAQLSRASQSKTAGDLIEYVRRRALGEPIPSWLVVDIRTLADVDRRAAFERIHETYRGGHGGQ